MFTNPNPYALKVAGRMPDKCPVCDQKYVLEQGFWFGAAFLSYMLSVIIAGLSIWVSTFFMEPSKNRLVAVAATSIIVLAPYTFRLSRAVWLGLWVKYQGRGK